MLLSLVHFVWFSVHLVLFVDSNSIGRLVKSLKIIDFLWKTCVGWKFKLCMNIEHQRNFQCPKEWEENFAVSTATIISIKCVVLLMQTNPIFGSFCVMQCSSPSSHTHTHRERTPHKRQYNCYLWVCPRSLITCLHDLFDDFGTEINGN